MSRVTRVSEALPARFPRVSGDEPQVPEGGGSKGQFSPRERG